MELAVAISVSAIIMTMLFTVVLSINSFVNTKEKMASSQSDLLTFKREIENIFEKYQEEDFILENFSGESDTITFQKDDCEFKITFEDKSLYENGDKVNSYPSILNVNFENKDNLVKCCVYCEENYKYVIILSKRV